MVLRKINPLTGRYIEDVIFGDDPPLDMSSLSRTYIATPIPIEIKIPRWDGNKWIDDFVFAESGKESFKEQTTIQGRLDAVEAATLDLILRR